VKVITAKPCGRSLKYANGCHGYDERKS
jgi:hypothetical protein